MKFLATEEVLLSHTSISPAEVNDLRGIYQFFNPWFEENQLDQKLPAYAHHSIARRNAEALSGIDPIRSNHKREAQTQESDINMLHPDAPQTEELVPSRAELKMSDEEVLYYLSYATR